MGLDSSVVSVSLDTNILVYYFDTNSRFHTDAVAGVAYAASYETPLILSVIVFTELTSFPSLSAATIKSYQDFFENKSICSILNVDVNVAKTAAFLRRKYRINTPDALILATAVESEAEVFITNDERLKIIEEIEVKTLADIVS